MKMTQAEFGQLIRIRRNDLGLTQVDVCAMTGIGQGYMSMYESGKGFPRFQRMVDLLTALKLEIDIYPEEETEDNEL